MVVAPNMSFWVFATSPCRDKTEDTNNKVSKRQSYSMGERSEGWSLFNLLRGHSFSAPTSAKAALAALAPNAFATGVPGPIVRH